LGLKFGIDRGGFCLSVEIIKIDFMIWRLQTEAHTKRRYEGIQSISVRFGHILTKWPTISRTRQL